MKRSQKLKLISIAISSALTAGAYFLPEGTVQTAAYVAAYLPVGLPVLKKSINNIRNLDFFDEYLLLLIASVGAFCIGEYFEAVAVCVFFSVGTLLESIAVDRSRKAISEVINLRADIAHRETSGGGTEDIDPEQLSADDIIIVNAGERIPVDSVVADGCAELDTSALTGESLPVYVQSGDEVKSGCVNLNGALRLKVKKVLSESTVTTIMRLVEESQESKAKAENFISRFAKIYTPAVIALAVMLAALLPLAVDGISYAESVSRALNFLVISCPCALVISVPLAYFCGIGACSKIGVLVKGGNYLDALSRTERMAFDKTGTVTTGRFTVTEILPAKGIDRDMLLYIAAAAESHSTHPVASAIKESAGHSNASVSGFKSVNGRGVCAVVDGKSVLAGSRPFLLENGVDVNGAPDGKNVYISVDGRYAGSISVRDTLKPEAADAFEMLRREGVKSLTLLSGDSFDAVRQASREAGADSFFAALLPQDKVAQAKKLMDGRRGSFVYVGDGINDAPLLALADVGISMGAFGSDAAIEASDAVIMSDNLKRIPQAISTARRTRFISTQNIIFALIIKAAALVLSALGLVGMSVAVIADVGVSVAAILNSLRILRGKQNGD